MEQAVITGLGCLSCLGNSTSQFWDCLNTGQSGVSEISGFHRENLRNTKAGEIKIPPDMLAYAKERDIASRISLFAHWAIEEALADSGLTPEVLNTPKVGLVLGVSLGMSLVQQTLDYGEHDSIGGPQDVLDDFSLLIEDLVETFSVGGEAHVITTACASGTNAIGIAKDMISYEGYDVVICGGVDTLDRMKYLGHTALNTLTTTTVKPFTEEREGTLFGEGAGILVLQKKSAVEPGAGYAICSGTGYSCDAQYVTAPDETGTGAIRVMREALNDAGVTPEDIGYINLHGSGTVANDVMECTAIEQLFGDTATFIPLSSIKPAIGHTMGAAGAIEAVATVLAVRHQQIPPTCDLGGGTSFPLQVIRGNPIKARVSHALSNSFGFGGNNGAVLFSSVVL